MNRLILICLTAMLALTAHAADDVVMCFTIVETNGEEVYFALSEEPLITYGKGTLTITTPTLTVSNLRLSKIVEHYYTMAVPETDKIGTIATMDGATAAFTNGTLWVTSIAPGAEVGVYTIDGVSIASVHASADGNACIDMTRLPQGRVYLIRTPGTAFKVMNK